VLFLVESCSKGTNIRMALVSRFILMASKCMKNYKPQNELFRSFVPQYNFISYIKGRIEA
jgi:hypothetical protein